MRSIVGLDPSMTGTGIAQVGEDGRYLLDLVASSGSEKDTVEQTHSRLLTIREQINDIVPAHSLVMYEYPSLNSKFGKKHDRSGLWWFIYEDLVEMGCRIVTVEPPVLKKYVTGKGNAGKDLVVATCARRYRELEINDNNVADAMGLLSMGLRLEGHPIEDLPQLNLTALKTVQPKYEEITR